MKILILIFFHRPRGALRIFLKLSVIPCDPSCVGLIPQASAQVVGIIH